MNASPVSIFRSFQKPILEAWAHLTRPELLALWLGRTELDLTTGAEFTIEHSNGDATRGHVLEAVPPIRLDLSCRSTPISPERRVTIVLEGDGPGSRATVLCHDLRGEAERQRERQFWVEALGALRTVLHEARDASVWGEGLPILARAALPRTSADLWPLIATGPGLDKWVAHVERFDAVVGGAFRLTSRFQGRQIVEEGRIEEIAPESRVALSWEWMGESWGAPTRVEFRIEAEPVGSSLSVIHSGFDRIAADRRLAARRNYAAAWPEVLVDLRRLVAPVAA